MEKYLIYDFNDDYGREPIIRKAKNGTLLCVFLTGGTWDPQNKNIVKIMKSYDDGKTWTEPTALFSHHSRGCWAPEMFVNDDKIILFVNTYNADNHFRELQTFYSISYDNGESFSEPKSIPGGLNGVSIRQGIVLSNNEYLFPLYWGEVISDFDWTEESIKNYRSNHIYRCGVAISSDKEKFLKKYGYIKSEKGLWEPNCVEVEPGHIIMYMRNNNAPYLGISHSYDYGRTWSEFKQTDIPNANTKVTLIKIDGMIIMINNFIDNTKFDKRTHLQLFVSKDGINWVKKMSLENDDECFFYPHAFYDDDNKILYVVYENSKQFYLQKIPYQNLVM